MDQHLSLAVSSNNHAASLIEDGEFNNAINILVAALKQATSQMAQQEQQQRQQEKKIVDDLPAPAVPSADDVSTQPEYNYADLKFREDHTTTQNSSTASFLVIESPLRVLSSSALSQPFTCSATIVFNLALAHHLMAPKTAKRGGLAKSMRLYQHAFSLIKHEQTHFLSSKLIGMAIMNNSAYVSYRLGLEQQAEYYCRSLLKAVVAARNDGSINTDELGINSFTDAFLSNTMHIIIARSKTAPAA